MKDRLEELQQKTQEAPTDHTNPFSVEGNEDEFVVVGGITPQAVVFEEEPVIQNFLYEAQKIRDDISVLETEVRWLNYILWAYFFSLQCKIAVQVHLGKLLKETYILRRLYI